MCCALLLTALTTFCSDATIRIEVGPRATRIRVVAVLPERDAVAIPTGLISEELGRTVLRLQLQDANGSLGPAIFGSFARRGSKLSFVPRFDLVPGETYVATFASSVGGRTRTTYRVPVSYDRPPPKITAVYPTASKLPANHLKFYIYFSQPMREGRDIFSNIHLLDAAGKRIDGPWRLQELWNDDATRFTLWIHPGRIKQGVKLRKNEGPVLVSGERYTLHLDNALRGADGQPLAKSFRKHFRSVDSDYNRPIPSGWVLAPPHVGTREVLRLDFGEPLDEALARRYIKMYGNGDRRVRGDVSLTKEESVWLFTPTIAWQRQTYRLLIDRQLEDLAGNTPARRFDTDLQQAKPEHFTSELRFRPLLSPE